MNIASTGSTIWDHKYVIGWIAVLSILAGYELWGVFSGDPYTPPLTRVAVRYCPWWITMPFLTWLWIHFCTRYFNPAYIKGLH